MVLRITTVKSCVPQSKSLGLELSIYLMQGNYFSKIPFYPNPHLQWEQVCCFATVASVHLSNSSNIPAFISENQFFSEIWSLQDIQPCKHPSYRNCQTIIWHSQIFQMVQSFKGVDLSFSEVFDPNCCHFCNCWRCWCWKCLWHQHSEIVVLSKK